MVREDYDYGMTEHIAKIESQKLHKDYTVDNLEIFNSFEWDSNRLQKTWSWMTDMSSHTRSDIVDVFWEYISESHSYYVKHNSMLWENWFWI